MLQLKYDHRLMCGDSTSEADVAKLMDGKKVDMVFTDPPYNVASDSKNFAAQGKGGWFGKSMDNLSKAGWDKDFDIAKGLSQLVNCLNADASIYIFCNHFLFAKIIEILSGVADFVGWCVWSKSNPMPSLAKRHWTWNSELVVYATKGKHTFNFPEEGNALASWQFPKQSDGSHPTQKPIPVCEHAINHSSNRSHLVLDLFLGSGSTLIACEKTGRKCFGMEIDPHYCSVIIKRYKDFCGKEVVKA